MAGYKPRKYGAAPTAVNNRQGLGGIANVGSLTPLGISTRAAPKPAIKKDPVTAALAARSEGMNQQYGLGAYAQGKRPAPQPAAKTPVAPSLSYDYSQDPLLNQIQALSSRERGDAQSEALRLRKQVAIDYGDEALGTSLGDENTAKVAASNPFSVRQQLKTGYEKGVAGLEEDLNDQNLFYGGHRAKELGDFANTYQGQLAGAAGQQQTALEAITRQLASALSGADERDIFAQQNAQGEALGGALDAGIDPGAGAGAIAAALAAGKGAKKKKKAAPATDLFGRQGFATPGGRGF